MIRTSNENSDLSVDCKLKNGEKVDFVVPRTTDSLFSKILSNSDEYSNKHATCSCWGKGEAISIERRKFHKSAQNMNIEIRIASIRTLLLLKRNMLYFNHQWEKTATDFHEMIEFLKDPEITKNLKQDAQKIRTKEMVHGNVQANEKNLEITKQDWYSAGLRAKIPPVLTRQYFLENFSEKEKIQLCYETVLLTLKSSEASNFGNVQLGMKAICINGPLWFADFLIDNWIQVYNSQFNYYCLQSPRISSSDLNAPHRLFECLPELVTNQILSNLNDGEDFRSMKLVCKRWYSLQNSEQFWKELFIFWYGNFKSDEQCFNLNHESNSEKSAANTKRSQFLFSWKVLYLLFAETASLVDLQTKTRNEILSLVDASIHIRKLGPD